MKRICVFGLSILLFTAIIMSGCRCALLEHTFYESGFYIYDVHNKKDKTATIVGLTDSGKEQEVLIIPQTIGNYTVVKISSTDYDSERVDKQFGAGHGMFNSDNLKRVYIPILLESHSPYFSDKFFGGNKIDALVMMHLDYLHNWEEKSVRLAANEYFRLMHKEHFSPQVVKGYINDDFSCINILPANVSFLYNYANAENDGYYWVDDYSGTAISVIPEEPTREGFTFEGWYKESEGLNKWDFEKDIIPKKEYGTYENSSNKYYTYNETKLYAKWVEK